MDDILLLVCKFLNGEGILYAIIGSIAVLYYGNPRTTMDIDIILKLREGDLEKLVAFMRKNDFFSSETDLIAAFGKRLHCTIEDKRSMIRLDLKSVSTEADELTLKRRKGVRWRNEMIYIASAEDTPANKLLFGSEQDLKDAEGLWVRQMGELDMKYLEERCQVLGVGDEFAEMTERVKRYLKDLKKR
jgi:hypothetical protein